MKFRYIILGIGFLVSLWGCRKEDELFPRSEGMTLRFEFPEGEASWDRELVEIRKVYATTPIYKTFDTTDLNRSWVSGANAGKVRGDTLNDEMAAFYVDFLKNHIFAFLKPELVNGVLPNYIFLVDNLRIPGGGGLYPVKNRWIGMDFWAFCLRCDRLPDVAPQVKPFELPKTAWDYKVTRGVILQNIIKRVVQQGKIAIPVEFTKNFDYTKAIKTADAFKNDPDYYMKRGFCRYLVEQNYENSSVYSAIGAVTPQLNFISYMHLGMRYSRDSVQIVYSTKDNPKVLQYYDFTVKYVKDNYGWDLTKMAELPAIKED